MKKLILTITLVVSAIAVNATNVRVETSCGVSVDMVYEDHHTLSDVIHDALILEEYFCG